MAIITIANAHTTQHSATSSSIAKSLQNENEASPKWNQTITYNVHVHVALPLRIDSNMHVNLPETDGSVENEKKKNKIKHSNY